jgi:ATP-dependent exoDNAse (exonuclease V) alpha subunit
MEGISKYTITVDVDDEMFSSENRIEDNKSDRELCDFTFGYGISCHKVQGSSIENVLFLDENVSFFLNQKKFRYTAVTRASKHITILK